MSKNMTRKGLAFGAGFALIGTTFGAPAFAADVDEGKYDAGNEYVSLLPESGESYAVLDDQFLDLEAQWTAGAGNGRLKLMVEDPEDITEYDVNTQASTSDTITLDDTVLVTVSALNDAGGDLVSMYHASNATAHDVAIGDAIFIEDFADTATTITASLMNGYHNVVGVSAFSGAEPANGSTVADTITVGANTSGSFTSSSLITMKLLAADGLEKGDIITISGVADSDFTETLTDASVFNGDHVIEDVNTTTDVITFSAVADATDITAGTFTLTADGSSAFTVTSNSITIEPGEVTTTTIAPAATSGTPDIYESTNANALDARAAILAATFGDTDAVEVKAEETESTAGTAGRDSDGTYVLDTEDTANGGTATVLRLVAKDGEKGSVRVVAWVDADDDNFIDSLESRSAVRTVQFVPKADVVGSITVNPVLVGDAEMTATYTSTPALNWDQMDESLIQGVFQRQGRTDKNSTGSNTSGDEYETWNTLTQEWTFTAQLNNDAGSGTAAWTVTDRTDLAAGDLESIAKSGKVVTVVTDSAHGLEEFDEVTVAATGSTYDASSGTKIRNVTVDSFTYEVASDTTTVAKTETIPTTFDITVGKFGFATAGTYSLSVEIGSTLTENVAASATASSATAAGVLNVATTSADVNGSFKVREDYTDEIVVTSEVTDADGDPVGADVPVKIAVTETSTGIITVNGTRIITSKTLDAVTDENGEVKITVTNSKGDVGDDVALTVTAQGSSDSDTLTWQATEYVLVDQKDVLATKQTDRTIAPTGTVDFDLVLADQFGQAPVKDSRVKIVLGGTRWSGTSYQSLSAGRASITIEDNPTGAVSNVAPTVTFTVQQQSTTGVWTDGTTETGASMQSGTGEIHADTITVAVQTANGSAVDLNADSVSSADLTAKAAVKATAASDVRLGQTAVAFSTSVDEAVNITGTVEDSLTESGAQFDGALITVSGPSNVLFRVGTVSAFGSLTFIGNDDGAFAIEAFSNTAQEDSVITVTSNGASDTVEITFEAVAAQAGTELTVTAPAYAAPGSTFTVKVSLADAFGNALDTGANDMKVTYTGPGLVVGTLPNETDEDGELSFSVLLGVNDAGSAVVVAQYDKDDDGSFTDSGTLTVSKTVTLGQAPAAQKVNAGSFKGYVAVYAKGYEGQRLSAKIGNDWVIVPSIPAATNDLYRLTDFTGAGVDIAVRIYIDRVLIDTINLTTK